MQMVFTREVHTCEAYWTLNHELTYFFHSFSVDGLKSFIIQDDKKVTEKTLFGTEQLQEQTIK